MRTAQVAVNRLVGHVQATAGQPLEAQARLLPAESGTDRAMVHQVGRQAQGLAWLGDACRKAGAIRLDCVLDHRSTRQRDLLTPVPGVGPTPGLGPMVVRASGSALSSLNAGNAGQGSLVT